MGVSTRTEHDYRTCRDDDCERFICRVYKEGYGVGYGAGYGAGHADGYAEGYSDGAADASDGG